MNDSAVTILGARGSLPVSGPRFSRYGGATTCVLVRLGGQTCVLDAGTGLLHLPAPGRGPLPLLITHPHLDHLLGLPLSPACLDPGGAVDIYLAGRMGMDAETILARLFRPPFWPVSPAELAADLRVHPLPAALTLGGVRVDVMEGVHPGGVSILRLTGGGRRVVFATDCTLTDELAPRLADFARDCDLLLIDGQYSEAEWPGREDFGHSRWTAAAAFGRDCGAKRVRITHHDPAHDDDALDAAETEVRAICPRAALAREKEEIAL